MLCSTTTSTTPTTTTPNLSDHGDLPLLGNLNLYFCAYTQCFGTTTTPTTLAPVAPVTPPQPPPQPPQPPPPQTSVIMGICLCLVTSTFIFVHIHNGLCILSKNIISVHLYTGLRGLGFVIRKWPTKTAIHLHKLKFHLAKHMSIYTKHKIYVNFTVCICRSILFLCIYTLKKTAVFNNWQPLQHFWKTSKKWLHTLIYQKTLLGFGAPTACLVTKQRQMGVRGDSAKILPMGLAPKT